MTTFFPDRFKMRRAWPAVRFGSGCLASLILLAASAPESRKARGPTVICPEKLPDDDARRAAVRDFVQHYGTIHPRSHIGERLAARERLLRRRGCRAEMMHHDFPET